MRGEIAAEQKSENFSMARLGLMKNSVPTKTPHNAGSNSYTGLR